MKSEKWLVDWFPPDVPKKSKTFKSREAAVAWLGRPTDEWEYMARDWNPILTHVITETTETVIPL